MKANKKNLSSVYNVINLQVMLAIASCLIALILSRSIKDVNVFYSAIIGAFVAIFPSYIYMLVAFKNGAVVQPELAIKNHKTAFLVKFLLNFILFAVVFIFYKRCNFLVLFVVFFLVLGSYWLSLISSRKK
jgi:F0F1-type ATP synthase assembly protein I